MASDPNLRAITERWFLRRGVPHLIEDYNASERIWTRARPFLIGVLLLETLLAFDDRYEGFVQGAMFALGIAVLIAALAALNWLTRQRTFDVPSEVQLPQLVFFVVAPALVALAASGDRVYTPAGTMLFNTVLLGLTYFVVGFGLIPMTAWAIAKLFEHLLVLVRLTARTLPVILVLTMFMFINVEIWQVAYLVEPPGFLIAAGIIALLGLVFVWSTSLRFVRRIRQPSSWREARERAADSPLVGMEEPTIPLENEPLRRGVKQNLRLLLVASLGTQVILVAAAVAAFYVAMGLLLITPEVLELWTSTDLHVDADFTISGRRFVLTREHLRVSAFLGTLAGLNVAVSALTDDTYREAFTDDLVDEMEQNLAVRALYRTLPDSTAVPASAE